MDLLRFDEPDRLRWPVDPIGFGASVGPMNLDTLVDPISFGVSRPHGFRYIDGPYELLLINGSHGHRCTNGPHGCQCIDGPHGCCYTGGAVAFGRFRELHGPTGICTSYFSLPPRLTNGYY